MTSVRRLLVLALVVTLSAGMAITAGFSYRAGLQEANAALRSAHLPIDRSFDAMSWSG